MKNQTVTPDGINAERPPSISSAIKPSEPSEFAALDEKYLLPEYKTPKSGLENLKSVFDLQKIKQLNTEAYIDLLRKHPTDMLTHVTRQGFRDHAGTVWHTKGLHEISNGFVNLLESGAIKSVLGRDMEGKTFDDTVKKFCGLDGDKDRFSACASIRRALESTAFHTNSFADKSSVHFATSVVMDDMYGGEKHNEIFFVLPSVVAGSNYKYSGRIEDNSHDQNNDVWLYAEPGKGVEIDTGFCFIPSNARVSPETGSRYNNDGTDVADPVSSKEYWESYFARTAKKPKHIIYYDSSLTPTEALGAWSKENGIVTDAKVEELEENNVDSSVMNQSEDKNRIKHRAYELLNEEMPADDVFLDKVFQYEVEEEETRIGVDLSTYLLTNEDRLQYEEYKSERKRKAFYVSQDPNYETFVTKMTPEEVEAYEKYLEDRYDWKEGLKGTAPPLPPFDPNMPTTPPPLL